MFWKKENKAPKEGMNWQELNSMEQLDTIQKESHQQPVLIYKHSTRCGISGMALNRLEREWTGELNHIKTYFLDLIAHRDISNAVQSKFGVYHESPQVILLENGNVVYNDSHMGVSAEPLKRMTIKNSDHS